MNITYYKEILSNGLRVIINNDSSTSLAAVNLLYNVGSKHESPGRTGFAHLFEHLMFGGSFNIPSFDTPLEKAGGTNNAFTNNDFTSYYMTLPAANLEIAFWLESDRMLGLNFSQQKLDVQRNVVIEEYKQRYLNRPYGDTWLLLRPLAYKVHPYQWPTIGKNISHIENATLQEVKNFFYSHYAPNNAILTVSGNVEIDYVLSIADKWFGEIPSRSISRKTIEKEPVQKKEQHLNVERDVPFDAIYKVYHTCSRNHPDFYATDMISDILSNGNSSRLYQSLVKQKKLFYQLDAYISGELEEGLFVFSGKLNKNVSMKDADEAISEEIEKMKTSLPEGKEIEKVKNKFEANYIYNNTETLNRAIHLSFYDLLGDAGFVNHEVENYRSVTPEQVQQTANNVFKKQNCSTLYYHSKTK